MGDDNLAETFGPTSGRIFGVVGLVVAAVFAVVGLVASPVAWGLVAASLVIGVLTWAAMLRPAAGIHGDALVLRGMIDTVRIPLAAIEEVTVRQVLAVRAGEKRYTSAAVGRTRRQMYRDDQRGTGRAAETGVDAVRQAEESYGLFVEDRIRTRASDARDALGIRAFSREQAALASGVERRLAVPELVAIGVALLAVVLAIVL